MEQALAHHDVHADGDSPRAQSISMMVGVIGAALVVAGYGVFAVARPQPQLGSADLVTVPDSGAVYVRVDDVVHPVLNLTSAQLITGTADKPQQVTEAAIAGSARGALLGIPGAPAILGSPLAAAESRWTVCDHEMTTVIAGPLAAQARPMDADGAILAVGPSGTTYLLYGGRRARVDHNDPVMIRALGIEGVAPVRLSPTLLDLLPEVAPLRVPRIPETGMPGPAALPGFTVGEVVQVRQPSGDEFYVVLPGGVQRVGQVAADVVRRTQANTSSAVTAVAPAVVGALPRLGTLAVESFPERLGAVSGAATGAVCVSWHDGVTDLIRGELPVTSDQVPVRLAQADAAGPRTDAVYLPAGRSAFVTDGAVTGAGWLVTELGVRFGVPDPEAAGALGMADPLPVPRAVLDALPAGPELSRRAALTVWDGIAAGGS